MTFNGNENRSRGFVDWLVRRYVPPGEDLRGTTARTTLGELEGYISTTVSVGLAGLKFLLGQWAESISLLADAVNNLTDVGTSLMIAMSFRWSRRPRDLDHPYGHHRIESVATLVLSLFLLAVAAKVAQSGIRRLLAPAPISAPIWLLIAVGAAVLAKTWLAGLAWSLARLTNSQVLRADAWNHIFDIASSLLVVLALICGRWNWLRADGYAAVGVSLFIAYTGWRYARESVNEIIGVAVPSEEMMAIRRAALSVPGVCGVHDVIVHRYGDVRMVSLHVEVSADHTLSKAHHIGESVEAVVSGVAKAKVVVHVDPVDRSHPAYARVEETLRRFTETHKEMVGYHDLRITGDPERYDLAADLVVRTRVTPEQFNPFLEEARDFLRKELAGAQAIDLGVETEYSSDPEHRRTFPPGDSTA